MKNTAPSSGQAAAAWRYHLPLVEQSWPPPGVRLALGCSLALIVAWAAVLLGPPTTAQALAGSKQPVHLSAQSITCVSAITVTSAADSGANSLRQAIADVCDDGSIDFEASLAGQMITLTTGELGISKTLTVANSNAPGLQISGNSASRIFHINAGAVVTLSQLSIVSGTTSSGSYGGGILNEGMLVLTYNSVTGNITGNRGGGIFNDGTLVVKNSTTSGNSAGTNGGGIFNNGILMVENSTISGNSATDFGGGIANGSGTLSVTNSTINGNLSGLDGGGIANGSNGTLTVNNSTLSGNSADDSGGGIANLYGQATIENSTISGNSALAGGGLVNGSAGTLNLYNTIIADSISGGDCSNDGTLAAYSATLIEDDSCNSTLNGDPLLGPLADNGGPTLTQALLPGSLAIDGGDAAFCPATDQRGVSRPQGDACDIGAFELAAVCSPTLTVTSVADSGANSLRQAIADVCDGGTIDFDASLAGQTITLTTGELGITKTLTVANPNAAGLQISSNSASRVFYIDANAVVTLSQLSIISGTAPGTGYGGGIINYGALTVISSTMRANLAPSGGGAIFNTRALTVTNSLISYNTAYVEGGGIYNFDGDVAVYGSTFYFNTGIEMGGAIANDGRLTVDNGIFRSNAAGQYGGAIDSAKVLTIANSTFLNNAAGTGGGISVDGKLTVYNSTFAANMASREGGGLYNYRGVQTIANTTFSANAAGAGGGVYNASDGTLQLQNTLIADSALGGDCANLGSLAGSVATLIEDGSCSPALSGDPLLSPLADNGGPTPTQALLPGSPAIDAGNAAACPASDQRGVARPQGGACDIGAFESRGFQLTAGGGAAQSTLLGAAFSQPLTLTVSSGAGEPVAGGQVIFSGPVSGAGIDPAQITATVGASGVASAPVTANLAAGSYDVSAAAKGAGAVTYALTNERIAAEVALANTPAVTTSSKPITLTASVTAALAAQVAPTGLVTFTANGVRLGTAALAAGGSTVFTTTALPAGSYTITATYGGDANHLAAVSNPVTQVVNATIGVVVAPAAGGGVSGGGVYAPGATVTVTASANPGYGFIAWQEGGNTVATTPIYTFTATEDRTLTARFSAQPTAVNDGAATLQGGAISIAVLANDLAPAGQGMTVVGVTSPGSGAAAIAAGAQSVTYTPDSAFSGTDTFTYRMRNASGLEDEALVVVIVTAQANSTDQPQAAAADPAVTSTLNLSGTQVSIEMTLPTGFYTGTLEVKDIFFFVFTRVMTPTADTNQTPSGLQFANLVFDLSAWRNGERLDPLTFSQPVTLNIRYDPALLGNVQENTLALLYWTGSLWSSDGITVVARDPANHVLTAVITHLSEFAFFAAAPTAGELVDEPAVFPHLFLPAIGRGE